MWANAPRRRVLIIDDDADVALATQRVMQRAGFDVRVAGSALEGIDAARETRPDIVLLDLSMPNFDGLDAVHVLRTEPATRDALVVAFSGDVREADAKRLRKMGFDDVLAKPLEAEALVARVAELLRSR